MPWNSEIVSLEENGIVERFENDWLSKWLRGNTKIVTLYLSNN